MKTSIRDKSIETSLESIKTEVINLKAAIVSTDTKDCNILNDQILNIETMSILNF